MSRQTQRYGIYQAPKERQVKNLQGEFYDIIGKKAVELDWERREGKLEIIPGDSNAGILTEFRSSILKLWQEFFSGKSTIEFIGNEKQELKKRLFFLEHEVDGLLKRKINMSVPDMINGERVLDYSMMLNTKENQILELERKIANLEAKLAKAGVREKELESEVSRLQTAIYSFEKPNWNKKDVEAIFKGEREYKDLERSYTQLKTQVGAFGSLLQAQIQKFRGSNIRFEHENELKRLLSMDGIQTFSCNGVLNFIDYRDRCVEVPTQDFRTKNVIQLLAVQMNKFFQKYPKLKAECHVSILDLFSGELLDMIQVDQLDRIVEIVKYTTQIQTVENVYAYSSEKSRKVEFHLRILIKALLQELQKIKGRHGLTLQIDEGLIGMIRQQIMDVVNIDDILKVFRVVPKIVEVEKIIEKVVDRVIEIPQIVPVEVIKEIPREIIKYEEIDRIINVPKEVIQVVDRVVQKLVPVETVREVIVEVIREVQVLKETVVEIPKIIEKVVVEEKIVEVEKEVIIEKIIHVPVYQKEIVKIIEEVPVTLETRVEVPYPVQVIVEKPVPVKQILHEPIQVERIVEKLKIDKEIVVAREIVNQIKECYQQVHLEKEKLVKFQEHHEILVPVKQTIEKIVEVRTIVPQIVQVKVIQEKIVEVQKLITVDKIIEKPVYIEQEKIRQVEKIVQVPVIKERIKLVPQQIMKVVVEKVEVEKIVEVQTQVAIPIERTQIMEVQKPVVHYIYEEVQVQMKVEKIVPVTKTIQRIKQVRVCIDKIVEKMVEVPKVVQVQKIVEKVVVVPRVIEKIVEVPQKVEVCVDRLVQTERIVEVKVIEEVPIVKEREKQIEVVKNIYLNHEIPKHMIEEKLVKEIIKETKVQVERIPEKIIEVQDVPQVVQLTHDRIIPEVKIMPQDFTVYQDKIVEVKENVYIEQKCQRAVPITQIEEKIVQVPQVIQNAVAIKSTIEVPKIVELTEQILKTQEVIRTVEDKIPYKQVEHVEVQCIVEKPVYMSNREQIVKTVQITSEKLAHEIYKIQEDKVVKCREDVPVEHTKLQIKENQFPVIIRQPYVLKQFKEVLHTIPLRITELQPVNLVEEKIVSIKSCDAPTVLEVKCVEEKVVIQKDVKVVSDINNYIEKVIEPVQCYSEKPVTTTNIIEKIVEVPHIIEKLVEKIVIMPQIVEVIKYVHEIVEEETLGVAVGVDVQTQEIKYKELYGRVKGQFEPLLAELRKIKMTNPAIQGQILIIEKFLAELNSLLILPRIVQVQKEIEVEKDKILPVLIPKVDSHAHKHQITLSLIIHKLMAELMRIQNSNPNVRMNLDKDVLKIFASDFKYKDMFEGKGQFNINAELGVLYNQYDGILEALGGSELSADQRLLYTSALQEKLIMGTVVREANIEIDKVKSISKEKDQAFNKLNQSYQHILGKLGELTKTSSTVSKEEISKLILAIITESSSVFQIPLKNLEDLFIHETHESFVRMDSALREMVQENNLLKGKLMRVQSNTHNESAIRDRDHIIQQVERRNAQLVNEVATLKAQSSVSVNVTGNTHEYEIKIRTLNSKIQELESQLRAQKMDFEGKVRAKDNRIRELEESVKIGNSQVTEMGGTHYGGGSSYSGNERMSSSVYSQSSGTDSQTPSKTPSSQTALSGAKQYGGGGNYTGYKGDNSSSGYSNTGGRITGATESSSTISYGRGEGNVSYGGNTGSGSGNLSGSGVGTVSGSGSGSVSYGGNTGSGSGNLSGSGVGTGGISYGGNTGSGSGNLSGSGTGSVSYGGNTGSGSGSGSGSGTSTGYQRTYGQSGSGSGQSGLTQSGSSQQSASYGRQYTTQQSGQSGQGATGSSGTTSGTSGTTGTTGSRFYSSSSSYRQGGNN